MKIQSSAAVVAAALLVLAARPLTTPENSETFLPPNQFRIAAGSLQAKGISKAQYDQVMDLAQAHYGPIIAARGGTLVINRLWDNDTVNASAQRFGSEYIVNMYGGLARHESITQDGMALVVCHEIGHHIGGAPKYGGWDWASNEGQSDYFANLQCLRRLYGAPAAAAFTRPLSEDVDEARAACGKVWAKASDRELCVRGSMAGMSVTTLFRMLRSETVLPKFSTPDPEQVEETSDYHPETQCRLDTYHAGSLCAQSFDAKLDENDPVPGTCVKSAGFLAGFRPRCWYKPGAAELERKAPALLTSLPSALRGL